MSWRRREERTNAAAALDAHPRQRKTLATHAFLAGFTALQILYLALDDLKLNIALSLSLAIGYIYAHNVPPRWRGLTMYAVSAISAIFAIYYFMRLRADPSMYGNLLGIIGGVLLVLSSFQSFTTNSHRFNLMLCVVFLLFGAVASYDLKFMLLLPLFLLFSGCALYTANQVDVETRAAGGGGGGGGRSSGQEGLTRQFVGVLLRAVGLILGLSIVAYVAAPHSAQPPRGLILNRASKVDEPEPDEAPGSSQPEPDKNASEIGLGDDFDLTQGHELPGNPTPVLKVKSHSAGYLRAQVFDVFAGTGWKQSPVLQPPQKGQGGEFIPLIDRYSMELDSQNGNVVPLVDFPSESVLADLIKSLQVSTVEHNTFSKNEADGVSYDINQEQVTLLADQPPFYFSTYQPYRLLNISSTESGRAVDLPLLDLTSTIRPQNLTHKHPRGFQYTVYSLEPRANAKQLAEVYSTGPDQIVSHYTWLPLQNEPWQKHAREEGLDPAQVRPISQRMINFARTKFGDVKVDAGGKVYAASSEWDTVQKINDYLVNTGGFEYSRTFPKLPPDMEVTEAFCFKTQKGFCMYFASAMAVLCRLNGIPARIVTGYSPGIYSLTDNAYIYKATNAHAWVEVYFDGYGWIMFDPTPTSRSRLDRPAATQLLSNALDFLQELFVVDPAATQKSIIEALGRLWQTAKDNRWAVLSGSTLVVVGVAGIWLIQRKLRRRKNRKRIAPENGVVVAYLRTQGLLHQLGFISETGDTARQLFAAAQQRFPWLAEPLGEFLPLYERAAYSSQAPEPEETAQAVDLLAQVEALVRQELLARKREKGRA